MGKRKGRREAKQPPIPAAEEITENGEDGKGSGFFACYLLTSLCPRFKGHTYIGYTLNPRRRIRQHNGEIGSGAWRTKRKRPWEMVLCIYGFPTNIAALQFEWAWQHPVESLAVRKAAASFKSLSGLANKIKLVYTMLTLPPWQSLNLTVNLFSTKYRHHTSACPALPEQMRTQVCSMDDLPCYDENACLNDDIECEGSSQECRDKESPEVHHSPSHDYIPEENFNHRINHIDDASVESSGCSVEFHREEDQGRFCINDSSPAGMSFPSTSSYVADETESPRLGYQPLIKSPGIDTREVEIIDVCTPSPFLEKSGSKKKKRRPNIWPEVIDLTNSPIYV